MAKRNNHDQNPTTSTLWRGKTTQTSGDPLESEGMLFLEEGLKGSVTYGDFRAPGRYANWKRQWYTACLALTQVRLVGLRYAAKTQRNKQKTPRLCASAGEVGSTEYRFGAAQGQAFLDKLLERTG